jgi:hypothetical protein
MAWPVKHGLCKQYANEYGVWISMKSRCLRRTHRAYEDYGGRGITVCERWMQFANFFADTGPRPSEGLSLDRIDNEKGYWCGKAECSECGPLCREKNWRWATREEQQRNTRASIMITYRGETRTIPEWSERLGIPASLIRRRVGYRAKNLLAPPRGKSTERRSLLTQTRRIWRSMIWRCQNEHAINFDRYGGRVAGFCGVPRGHGRATVARPHPRSNRLRRQLRTVQLPMGHGRGATGQSEENATETQPHRVS